MTKTCCTVMIAIFKGPKRIGSLLKFALGKKRWYAYSYGGACETFKTRKEAVAWLVDRVPIAGDDNEFMGHPL